MTDHQCSQPLSESLSSLLEPKIPMKNAAIPPTTAYQNKTVTIRPKPPIIYNISKSISLSPFANIIRKFTNYKQLRKTKASKAKV